MEQVLQLMLGAFALSLMLSVGMDLEWRRLEIVWRRPGRFGLGILLNFVVVPCVAAGLVAGLDVTPAAGAAVIIMAVAPGGPMGAFLAQQARGDLAMAVALLLALNLLNPLLTPGWIDLLGLAQEGTELELFGIFKTLVGYQLIPLSVGLLMRDRVPAFTARWQPRVSRLAQLLLVIIVVGFTITNGEVLSELSIRPVIAILGTVGASLGVGLLFGIGERGLPASLALTAGIRNGSMALVLVGAWFPDPKTLLTALGYSVIMFPSSLAVTAVLKRRAGPSAELAVERA